MGARYGQSSEVILRNFNVEHYTVVDPYETYSDYDGDGFDEVLSQLGGDTIYEKTKERLGKLGSNIEFHRTFSDDQTTLDKIDDGTLDLIFIDGYHTYQYVLADLNNYWVKLKRGGVICGDDFHMRSAQNDVLGTLDAAFPEEMVFGAVTKFCRENSLIYQEYGSHRGYAKTFGIWKN